MAVDAFAEPLFESPLFMIKVPWKMGRAMRCCSWPRASHPCRILDLLTILDDECLLLLLPLVRHGRSDSDNEGIGLAVLDNNLDDIDHRQERAFGKCTLMKELAPHNWKFLF